MKKLLYLLLSLCSLLPLRAQHLFRQDSLGVSLDFPCEPQSIAETVESPAGPVQLNGHMCSNTPLEAYVFSYYPVKRLVENPAGVRAALEDTRTGMMRKLGATVKGEKYKEAKGLSTLRFSFSSSVYQGFVRIMFTRGTLLQLAYMSRGKPDKKGWQRFSKSFTLNGIQ